MPQLSIASFNTRWGVTDQIEPYDLAAELRRLDTEVVALQEVWEPADGTGHVAPAAAELGYQLLHVPMAPSFVAPRPEITADPSAAAGTWGVALLTRLPVRRTRLVELGRLLERWDVATRYALLAELDLEGHPLTVAAHHLSFAMPNALAQLRRLGGAVPVHQPSIVVGDCNMWGVLATRVLRRHRRAVVGRTWPAHRPHSQLDHILVSPEIGVVSGEVLGPTPSDHRPIRATLTLPAAPPGEAGS